MFPPPTWHPAHVLLNVVAATASTEANAGDCMKRVAVAAMMAAFFLIDVAIIVVGGSDDDGGGDGEL